MNNWEEIKTEEDLRNLLTQFGGFHDSCIRDIYISTSDFVDKDLSMSFHSKIVANVLFQRQAKSNSVLELKFEDVISLNFKPLESEYSAIIYDATLIQQEGLFYWADFADWEIGDNDSIWMAGKKLFWRFRTNMLGKIERLG